VNLIEAFDQPWKRLLERTAGGYWGVYDDARRELKFRFGEPVSNHPDWRQKAGLGIGAVKRAEQEPENLSDDLIKLAQIARRIVSEVSG